MRKQSVNIKKLFDAYEALTGQVSTGPFEGDTGVPKSVNIPKLQASFEKTDSSSPKI